MTSHRPTLKIEICCYENEDGSVTAELSKVRGTFAIGGTAPEAIYKAAGIAAAMIREAMARK